MREPKEKKALITVDFVLEETVYCADFYERFARFVGSNKKTFLCTEPVRLEGKIPDQNDPENTKQVLTPYILFIKKIRCLPLSDWLKLYWWEPDRVKRVYCAETESKKYYFRLRDTVSSVRNRVVYINSNR